MTSEQKYWQLRVAHAFPHYCHEVLYLVFDFALFNNNDETGRLKNPLGARSRKMELCLGDFPS
jgi:hypothetical protein